jgi:hypothetical protein
LPYAESESKNSPCQVTEVKVSTLRGESSQSDTLALLALIDADLADEAEAYDTAQAYEAARPARQLILTIRNSLGREEVRNAKAELKKAIAALNNPEAITLVKLDLETRPGLEDFCLQLSVRQLEVETSEKLWAEREYEREEGHLDDLELEMMEYDNHERQRQQAEDVDQDRHDLLQDGKPPRARPGNKVAVNLGGVSEMSRA